MFKNNFKIAWRNLSRHKAYAAINVSGLAVGIASCLLLFTVLQYELSYDTFQPGYNRIYHVVAEEKGSEGTFYNEGVPFPAYDALRVAFPDVETAALFQNYNSQVAVIDAGANGISPDKKFLEGNSMYFTDARFFSVFQYHWLSGSPAVLNAPNTVVMTQKAAAKYFGNWQAAMGRLLKLDNTATVKVSGILQDLPDNTDFPLGIVASYETMKSYPAMYGYNTEWGSITSSFQAFMRLPEAVSASAINKRFAAFDEEHFNKDNKGLNKRKSFLQPLSEVHFDKRFGNFGDHITSKTTLWTLALIGVFIIVMACINFINLSTAQAVGRSKEVGIRKVLGSNRSQLFRLVLGETAIIVGMAVLLAFGIAFLCMPYLQHIASTPDNLSLFRFSTVGFVLLLALVVILLAGTYPSLVLSGFKPVSALKNKITSATVGGISLRRGLVVTQFAISQVLIIGTLVAVSQMNFISNADLGYQKEAVLYINNGSSDSAFVARQPAFKQALLALKGVQSVSFSSDIPSSESNNSGNFAYDHRPDEKFDLFRKFADDNYFKTYGLQLVAGRNYSASDTVNELVINETLASKLGAKNPADVIGHELRVRKNMWRTVVGVVKDFKTNSMREAIKPLVLMERNISYGITGIKLQTSNPKQTGAEIEKVWNQFYPEYVFTPKLLDDTIQDFYTQENQLSLLYKIFAAISIFISCLGLYGMISFMASQKTKEVGIRKVLGASVRSIIYLFSKEFTVLIVVAFCIAAPIAYYMMHNWLSNFAFQVPLSVWIFILSALSSILIAWITVGYKSVKAAIVNPVKSLRSE